MPSAQGRTLGVTLLYLPTRCPSAVYRPILSDTESGSWNITRGLLMPRHCLSLDRVCSRLTNIPVVVSTAESGKSAVIVITLHVEWGVLLYTYTYT